MSGAEIAALLAEHKQDMLDTSPEDAVFTLPIDSLRSPDIVIWSAWVKRELAGCGALKALDPTSGEIKSMRTSTAHRGTGVGSAICEHIIKESRNRGYEAL
ncbi:MAG: GNAT family N-acetyltransferase, partial [Pseudomonadota bacterium]